MITGGSRPRNTNAFLNFVKKYQDDIHKLYLYGKNLSELKYEYLIKKREYAGTKYFSNPDAFIEFSNTMDDVYENIDDYIPNKQTKN